jgi:fatty acid-binding protein DegV
LHVAALEAACPERARSLLAAVLDEVPDADAFVGSFGAVMLVHVGPGLVGLSWWWET